MYALPLRKGGVFFSWWKVRVKGESMHALEGAFAGIRAFAAA